jgi:hypothetical protein
VFGLMLGCYFFSRRIWTFCRHISTAWSFFEMPPALSKTSSCSKYCQIHRVPWAAVYLGRNPGCFR